MATQAPARAATRRRRRRAPAVRLRGIRRTYGDVVAIANLDLDIAEGEFFTMLGPSGSGKTTTLRVIAGFERPDTGHVELAGADVTGTAPSQRDVNTVFQDYALFPHMTVLENVEYGLRVKGIGRRERRAKAEEVLERVRLPEARRRASRCSSPAASGSASRWRARSSTARPCCCSTSRSARST